MDRDELDNLYFNWLYQLVCNDLYSRSSSHRKLLMRLHSINFYWLMEMDANRAYDGINLRKRFEYEFSLEPSTMDLYFKDRPCSVLEMMIALAVVTEQNIMDDPNYGDRTGQWFWSMIVSLGLGGMTDQRYNKEEVDNVIFRFLARDYSRDGKGGLFTLPDCEVDMRKVEIWGQMCWYINTII